MTVTLFHPPFPKTPCCMQTSVSMFDRTGIIADRSLTLREYESLTFLASVTLTLTRWPSYTNSTRSSWKYIAYANMNFLCQDFRKLSSDRHTYRQTDRHTDTAKIIYHAASRVVNNCFSMWTEQLQQNMPKLPPPTWRIRIKGFMNYRL